MLDALPTAFQKDKTVPNRYGLTTSSRWEAIARAYWQPCAYAPVSLGTVAYEGEIVPDGRIVSLGFDRAQLDIGCRVHGLSPFTDSAIP